MYFSQFWPWVAPSALALVLSFQRCLLFSLPLFLALYYPVFCAFCSHRKKKSYKKKKCGAVNQISRLELWMGEREIIHRARVVGAEVFEDSYVAYVLWKAISVANPPTYLYSEAECQRNPVLEKGSPLFLAMVRARCWSAWWNKTRSHSKVLVTVWSKSLVWFGARQKI